RPGLDCGEDFVGMERKFQNGEPQIEFTKADVMSNMNPRTVPPTLAIYGDADLAVDKSQTEEFCARLGSRCTPVKIKGA
ncbi:hypothetical protein, partial [Klebsiella pneumoniae]|uniref:hypothetical protein n=1 Tax=Klebsiella pneumoniae TaxID=573 RepID=UPI003EE12D1F